MLLMTGKTIGVTRETRGQIGNQFESVEIHLLEGVRSVAVRVGQKFDQRALPSEGELVALEVVASSYKTRDGSARTQVTALARNRELEDLLFGQERPMLSAVNES